MMTEGRVFWHYTCPICKEMFEYGVFAGPQIKICQSCRNKLNEDICRDCKYRLALSCLECEKYEKFTPREVIH